MASGFSLNDQLFNAETIGQLAREHGDALDGFDGPGFVSEVLAGFPDRGLLERMEWIADCLEPRLAADFPAMADQLEAAMPPPLDPTRTDDDFGQFIHAMPGILAVRHGMERHRDRALDLLEAATQRFSMEFYIRPFLNRWPEETLARLSDWAAHPSYHVRRLVSEGTRPRLPWAKNIEIDPLDPLPLLTRLHADPTRYVTRSVANHMNDLSKRFPDTVFETLAAWHRDGKQDSAELAWMTRHALRTLIKQGDPRAMAMLGFDPDAPVNVETFALDPDRPAIGDKARIAVTLSAPERLPVLVDYVLRSPLPSGKTREKVFKLKQAVVQPGVPLTLEKTHSFKGDATTYTLLPGRHELALIVNGVVRAQLAIDIDP